MVQKQKKIAFIGSGRMAEALIKGIISSGLSSSKNISASDISSSRLRLLKAKYKVRAIKDNLEAVRRSDVIVLSVKPQIPSVD